MSKALYDKIGVGYAMRRRLDTRIAAQIDAALGDCHSVLNAGAGAGSYEPANRFVLAVEPSREMIRQRPAAAAQAIQASAHQLPFRDQSFDAALAILTVHHWPRRGQGLAELRRVARERVVIMTWDPEHPGFWLVQDYFPEILAMDLIAFPSLGEIAQAIGPVSAQAVPVPADCADGFLGAFWQRPANYLDPVARGAISVFSRFDAAPGLERLQRDLDDGTWLARHGSLLNQQQLDVGYRLVVASYLRPS